MCGILDGKTGRLIRTIRLRREAAHFAWSPDGTTLAVSGADSKIDLWDAATSTRRATLEGHYNVGIRVAYHPAGRILASTDWSEQLRLWDSAVGRHLLNITGDGESVIIADGRIVVSRHGQLIPFEVNPALEYRTLAHSAAEPISYFRPSVRHDGRLLAVGTNQGAVIWDLAHGTELAFLPIGNAAHLMFDKSGDLITSGRWASFAGQSTSTPVRDGSISVLHRRFRCGAGTCGIAVDKTGAIVARADQGYCLRRDSQKGHAASARWTIAGASLSVPTESGWRPATTCGVKAPRSGASPTFSMWRSFPAHLARGSSSAPMENG